MNEKTLLWLILIVVAADLYIDYRVASALQEGESKVKGVLGDPVGALTGLLGGK